MPTTHCEKECGTTWAEVEFEGRLKRPELKGVRDINRDTHVGYRLLQALVGSATLLGELSQSVGISEIGLLLGWIEKYCRM